MGLQSSLGGAATLTWDDEQRTASENTVLMSPTELTGLRGRFSLQAAHESLRRSVLQPREPKDVISMLSEPQDGTKALPEGEDSLIFRALATHSATHARSFVETAARSTFQPASL